MHWETGKFSSIVMLLNDERVVIALVCERDEKWQAEWWSPEYGWDNEQGFPTVAHAIRRATEMVTQ